jgi:hypothetical protein
LSSINPIFISKVQSERVVDILLFSAKCEDKEEMKRKEKKRFYEEKELAMKKYTERTSKETRKKLIELYKGKDETDHDTISEVSEIFSIWHEEFLIKNPPPTFEEPKEEERKKEECLEQQTNTLLQAGKRWHYCTINSLSRLLSSQMSGHKTAVHFCRRCMNGFQTETLLASHKLNCESLFETDSARLVMPEIRKVKDENGEEKDVNPIIEFKNFYHAVKVPFHIIADFESFISDDTKIHTMASYAYQVVCGADSVKSKPLQLKMGSAEMFMEDMMRETNEIFEIYNKGSKTKPVLNKQEEKEFKEATKCYICSVKLERAGKGSRLAVRDHCHVTQKYRGPACSRCNLSARTPQSVPILFHNLKGYDAHHIIRSIKQEHGEVDCIPNTDEKYSTFTIGKMKFVDSYALISASLDNLAKAMAPQDFKYTDQLIWQGKNLTPRQIELVHKKLPYPYDYLNSNERMAESTPLAQKDFYNIMTDSNISDADYKLYLTILSELNIKTNQEFHDLYLSLDVLQLTDVVEKARENFLTNDKLDMLYYISLPQLSYQSMLRMTGVKIEQLTDLDMYQFFEKGIRGGISTISHRHAKANNKYMPNYDVSKNSDFLLYVDMNNLYGGAMCQKLPVNGFMWVEGSSDEMYAQYKSLEEDFGMTLEVDLEYSIELHDLHNEYPLCPEHQAVTSAYLSLNQHQMLKTLQVKHNPTKKLVGTLENKTNYVVHHRYLRFCEEMGLKVTKVHRAVQYAESDFLKRYIDFNTALRTKAVNKFEQDIFKLKNNAVFGKFCEDVRKRVNFALVTEPKLLERRIAKPTFKRVKIFTPDLVGVHMHKTKIMLNKPVFIGQCILDESKLDMARFHYTVMKTKYGNKATLMFTDTDSFAYKIQTEDLYADMTEMKDRFDLSNYPPEHPLYDETNKKQLYKMKDELGGSVMTEFVGLRSKMYSYVKVDPKSLKTGFDLRAKGVGGSAKKKLSFEMYKNCIEKSVIEMVKFHSFKTDKHVIKTAEINKIGLSPFDDKRYICDDGVSTLAHGHYSLRW